MKTRIQNKILAVTVTSFFWLPFLSQAQEERPKERPQPGNYYSAQSYESKRPPMPPLPFNPFPELPVYAIGERTFIYDDRSVDYEALRKEAAERQAAEAANQPAVAERGEMMSPLQSEDDLRLKIETFDAGVKVVSFNTVTGLVYHLQQKTNLNDSEWTTIRTLVATSTNADYTIEDGAMAFYRVVQEDDTIQFPDWFDAIYQLMEFTVYTPLTAGTIDLELYADGQLVFSDAGPIPPSGTVRLYDPNYDPAQWPNTGYYGVGEWELHVTVTPAAAFGGAAAQAQRRVKKEGRQRNPPFTYYGMTVEQGGNFSTATTAQDEVDEFMFFYLLANYQACEIVDWNFNLVDPIDRSIIPGSATLYNTNQWAPLRQYVSRSTATNTSSAYIDYFHYFGHGSSTSIGGPSAANAITLSQLNASAFLKTNKLTYVALDGCRTCDGTDFINALVGFRKTMTRLEFVNKGLDPHFGCGWNKTKAVGWVLQGEVNDRHFWYWSDFYYDLTKRNPSGLMFRRYRDAAAFAKTPSGLSPFHNLQTNPDAAGFVTVGCDECRFDERPGIIQ
jgi:hypothetical protein